MSRILNRPMFRGGGKVSSYGKGIASGLTSKPKRGLVDEPGGYAGISMSTIPSDIYNKIFNKGVTTGSTGSTGTTGASVVEKAKEKVKSGTSKTKNLFNKSKSFLKSKKFSEKGIMDALKKYGPKATKYGKGLAIGTASRFPLLTTATGIYGAGTPTPVDEKYNITRMDNIFPMFGDTVSTMQKKFKRNFDESANPNNFWRYDPGKHGPRKEHPLYDPSKVSINPFNKGAAETDLTPKAPTGIKGPPGGGETSLGSGEAFYDKSNVVEEPKELTMKEQVAKDKELFAELLGEGEARGKDVSDMLLRFAGSGGNTVGEKFQQYIGAEAMAGPSRTEKINQAAASLAINDYIAGKRSKENMEMMLERTKFGVDYTLDAQKAAKDISNMDFGEALTFYSENVFKGKKGRMDPQTIKGVLSIQMPGKQINIKNFTKKNLNEVANLDATEFDIGLNIVTYDGGKIILERVGETISEVPNLFIT